jgi:hypothetical protein
MLVVYSLEKNQQIPVKELPNVIRMLFRYSEWECASREQCIPRSFHCDGEMDCQDQSDEIGCSKS